MPAGRGTRIALAGAGALLLVGAAAVWFSLRGETGRDKPDPIPADRAEFSAWLVDWQLDAGMEEAQKLAGGPPQGLQLFAAYFDETDALYFSEDMKKALSRITELRAEPAAEIGLTLVNDIVRTDGSSAQKDADLVTRLVATEESRGRHIRQIIDTLEEHGLNRVEIDYEKINKEDWTSVSLFYEELYEQLKAQGKTLRIVLEPKAPVESVTLPEGPEYVMMAYNLFGSHSGPGPKADLAFIRKVSGKLKSLPGKPVIALAAGGFDWSASGEVTAVTEKKAKELAQAEGASLQRDKDSGSLHFEYRSKDGEQHTVWFADRMTLNSWVQTAREEGINSFSLWRLGELAEDTLEYWKEGTAGS
ncbi:MULTISPECIES: glycosyl hydrolase family 18 protein [Paenibacillus]|uniref:glycosyl hydrolase family 18 protein n=1 Tax=Paenibacillus TaxID=44249 RepID=UPI002FE1641A